jgi:DNA recombination protein RmuC
MNFVFLFPLASGLAVGFLVAWFIFRSNSTLLNFRLSEAELKLSNLHLEVGQLGEINSDLKQKTSALEATLNAERQANDDKLALLQRAEEKLREVFRALSGEALKSNNQAFLELAKQNLGIFQSEAKGDLDLRKQAVESLVAPISESLKRFDEHINQIESDRKEAYGALKAQVHSLLTTQEQLHVETGSLVKALRTPTVRGRWGEMQLKRVVEIAGMLPYVDFVDQETVVTSTGRLRPDLIVKLPGAKNIVVDAKTPLLAYLDAMESTDEEGRQEKLMHHAKQVREHLDKLSSKAYWEQFEASPEFVCMFLPGETFFSAALEQDPSLIEYGVEQRVIPASPTTLIALLKAVAFGWTQEKLTRNAQQISVLGKELHERLRNMSAHIESLGKGLDRAVDAYNKAVGSLEARVMVSARRFAELGAPVAEEIPFLQQIETTTRNLTFEFVLPIAPEEGLPVVEPEQPPTQDSKVLGGSASE